MLNQADMAEVMADLHVGEAVVEMNHHEYRTDSSKMALRQAIFDRHGIDQEKFDTSLAWYAHHMDKYMDVCDREIKILEDRNANAGSLMLEMAMSVGGDSVDVWGGARHAIISDRFPNHNLVFDFKADENMEIGDYYIWRLKLIEAEDAHVQWTLLANYSDSTCEYVNTNTTTKGWNELSFFTDSTKQLQRLRGTATPTSNTINAIYVDSIQLIRKRLDSQKYSGKFRQRTYKELYPQNKAQTIALKEEEKEDTVRKPLSFKDATNKNLSK